MKLTREIIETRRAILRASGRRSRKRKTIPRQRPPTAAKLAYARLLNGRISMLKEWVGERIEPLLPSLVETRRVDATISDLVRIFDEYAIFVARERPMPDVESVAKSVDRNSEQEHQRQMRAAIGVETITPSSATQQKIEDFVASNTSLVKDFDAENLKRLRETVTAGVNSAERVGGLRQRIEQSFGVAKSRAALIARDQMLKLHGQLAETRQTSAGFTEYTWSTSGDQRVRDRHAQLEGTRQRWDAPPIVDLKSGRRAHPGQDFQCRCQAIPVIPEEWL